jgi:hypothetical protein
VQQPFHPVRLGYEKKKGTASKSRQVHVLLAKKKVQIDLRLIGCPVGFWVIFNSLIGSLKLKLLGNGPKNTT